MAIQYSIPSIAGDFSVPSTEQAGFVSAGDVSTIIPAVDALIDFEGFEKYGPSPGVLFQIPPNFLAFASSITPLISQSFYKEWNSLTWSGNSPSVGLINGLGNKGGTALAIANAFGNSVFLYRFLNAVHPETTYTRVIMGFAMASFYGSATGAYLCDNGTGQCFLGVDTGGRVIFNGSTNLYTSTNAKVMLGARHYFEMDVFIHNTAGTWRVWMDGILLASGTGANTRAGTSNNYANSIVLVNGNNGYCAFDDLYWRDNTTGTASPYGDCTIKALPVTSDSSVQFTSGAILGNWVAQQTLSTNSPGANILILVPVTPTVNMTVNSIGSLPRTTAQFGKFKGVIYSDSSGAPGSLLSSGTEVIGSTTGVNLSLPLVTPQALTGGTQYWIGLITDTSIAWQLSNVIESWGQSKANTYTGGAPAGPLSGMTTGLNPWSIWGVCSGSVNYAGVSQVAPPPVSANAMLSYNEATTALAEDLFETQNLTTTPASIYSVKVSVMAKKPTAGVRSMDIRLKTGAQTNSGNNTQMIPITTPKWYSSRFDVDPTTGVAWDATGINGMKVGYKTAT
jgi:hypothetical protein